MGLVGGTMECWVCADAGRPRRGRAKWCIPILGAAIALAGCGGSSNSVATSRPGLPIPTRNPPPATTTPGITTANGAPRITQFQAPTRFWCMPEYPNRAQVTIGWNVPSATTTSAALDGHALAIGKLANLLGSAQPPFVVLAGGTTGIGTTVVFPCVPGQRHTITLRWRIGQSPITERVVTVTKAPA